MAYNKANGGVPIKGDASTSGVHNPKTGRVDNPQSLGGSIMNLGKSSCHEASSCEGGMTNISSGAGNEGAGSHKPVLKEDTSLVNYREPLDLPYKGRHQFGAGFSNGAVTANSGATFFVSFGPSFTDAGTPFPQDPNDPANEGLACPNTEEQIKKYGRTYLPVCDESTQARCCDANDLGPCEYHYWLFSITKFVRYNDYIPRNAHSEIREWILACIDLTVAYAPGDPIQWLEPAALNLLLPNPTFPSYGDLPQDGQRLAFWKDDMTRASDPFGSGDEPISHTANENICWIELKARTDLDIVDTTPQIDDVDFYWSDGSDIDKVLKQYVKVSMENQTYDHRIGGCLPWWENTDKPAYWQPSMTDEFHNYNPTQTEPFVKFTLTDWTNNPDEIVLSTSEERQGKAHHKYWGGERADQWYYLRINSVTKTEHAFSTTTVVKFQWARQNSDVCANLNDFGEHVIIWNAEQTIDSTGDRDWVGLDSASDESGYWWWKVVIENNVSLEFALGSMHERNPLHNYFTGPYNLEVLRYGYFENSGGHGHILNGGRCQSPDGTEVPFDQGDCTCPQHIPKGITKQVYIDAVCSCPERYAGFPVVVNNVVAPDIDSAWGSIREAHGYPMYSDCNCLGDKC